MFWFTLSNLLGPVERFSLDYFIRNHVFGWVLVAFAFAFAGVRAVARAALFKPVRVFSAPVYRLHVFPRVSRTASCFARCYDSFFVFFALFATLLRVLQYTGIREPLKWNQCLYINCFFEQLLNNEIKLCIRFNWDTRLSCAAWQETRLPIARF